MLQVCYSNRLDQLAAALIDSVQRRRSDPPNVFATTTIVVPNQSVATYIKVATARRLGVAANLSFPFLDAFLASTVTAQDARALDRAKLHALLIGLLADNELLAEPELSPVRDYIYASGRDASAVELRRFQLAGELGALFSAYAVGRAHLLAAWPHRTLLDDTPMAATERWQRRLWRALIEDGGALTRARQHTGVRWQLLPELLASSRPADLALPDHAVVFGFSYMAPAYVQLLVRLAELTDLEMYALNPSREFWEDLDGAAEVNDAPLLRRWGRPGRVNVRTLNAITNHSFDGRFIDPLETGGDHLLARVQRDVLDRALLDPGPGKPPLPPAERTIGLLACPTAQRELEIIGNRIWDLVLADDTLRFNDIAVLIAGDQQQEYQAHVATVFRDLHDIPYHVVDQPLSSESRIVEAFDLLLDLPLGTFTRPELLRLLTHPAVLARYPDVDADDWVHWAEQLGIVHGADHNDHQSTYIKHDVFNWDQGIRRLALGAFMGEAGDELMAPVEFGGARYVPEPLRSESLPSAARFCLLARSLIEDARFCRERKLPLARWREFIDVFATSYLTPSGDDDERNFDRCRDAVAGLAACDLDGRAVSYRIAREFVRQRLATARSSQGELLADGVMLAPLVAMRPLPMRVVFVAGLGEGLFPSGERHSALDLRRAQPQPSDVSSRDRDRYAFLETLMCARERLFLSWVARDQQSGEALEPSVLVQELLDVIAVGYTGDAAALIERHPLRHYDPQYFPELGAKTAALATSRSPSAHRQARALALRNDLVAHLRERELPMPSPDQLRAELRTEQRGAMRRVLGIAPLGEATAPVIEDDRPIAVTMAMVRRFLESPLQAWASFVLGLRDTDHEDVVGRADEPFVTPRLDQVKLLRDVFIDYLQGRLHGSAPDLHGEYTRRATRHALTGKAPTGLFAELERQRDRAVLDSWSAQLARGAVANPDEWRLVAFGRARRDRVIDELLPPLRLDVAVGDSNVRVDLVGQTELQCGPDPGSVVLVAKAKPEERYLLYGVIDQVIQAAAGRNTERAHAVTILTTGDEALRYQLAPWTERDARSYLAGLIGELLGSRHDYLLPSKAVFTTHARRKPSVIPEIDYLRRSRTGFDCRYGPVTSLGSLRAPADADELVLRRFGPIFDRIQELRSV